MANRRRYKDVERVLTQILLGELAVFLLYLIFAGVGVVALKVITAILIILVSGLCLAFLVMCGEVKKRRSLWLVMGFGAIALVLLVSLLLNYPSPDPLKQLLPGGSIDTTPPISTMILDAFQF